MTSKHEFNIFDVIGKLRKQDIDFFLELSDEQLKSIAPYVLMLWLSDSNNKFQIDFLNDFVNKYVYSINDKRLLLLLLIASIVDTKTRYRWTRKKAHTQNKLINLVVESYNVNKDTAKQYLTILTEEQIEQLCVHQGIEKKERKEIIKQFRQFK